MPEKQSWESLRQRVDDQQTDADSVGRRLEHVEKKLNTLEVSLVKQLEALTVAYQHMSKSLDKLVTRSEIEPIQKAVGVLCICVIVAVVWLIFRGPR